MNSVILAISFWFSYKGFPACIANFIMLFRYSYNVSSLHSRFYFLNANTFSWIPDFIVGLIPY